MVRVSLHLGTGFLEVRGDSIPSWGAYTMQGIMVGRVRIGCWFMGLVAKVISYTGNYIWD